MPKPSRGSRQQPIRDPRARGLAAFQAGRFDEAIAAWRPLAGDAAVGRALAEALLRRALRPGAADPLADLRRGAELAPNDPRFPFQLGRLLHRDGDLAGAEAQYRAVLAREPGNLAAAKLLALLTLARTPGAELADLSGLAEPVRDWAAPALAVLRREAPPADESPLGTLWRGLYELAVGSGTALATLSDERPLPNQALAAFRRFHRGSAAVRAGNTQLAIDLWGELFQAGLRGQRLEENLAALLHGRLTALQAAGKSEAAGQLALEWFDLPGGPAFDELRVAALDRVATAAALAGDWEKAAPRWEAARQILGRGQGLGSPRPILHNLAMAYERVEDWEGAAEAWRAMLRTRPRKRDGEPDPHEELRWAWVRSRIIDCYKHAGRPDEAVTVFRQAIKADPDDLDLRVQLADALMANEQERAAINEVKRILKIDPHHPEAVLRMAEDLSGRWQFAEAEQLVRAMVAHHGDREDLRRRAAEVFLNNGRAHAQYGHAQAAYDAFVEGERFDPSNPRFPINQARMLSSMGRHDTTAGLLERALAVAGEVNETWVLAIETWMQADKIDEARALIGRFEAERGPTAEEQMALGLHLLAAALPPQPPFAFGRMVAAPKTPTSPALAMALEQIEKALAARPDDLRMLMAVASFLMLPRSDLALPFARRAAALAPDDPEALILLGVVLGLDNQGPEAKKTLQQASQVAGKAGKPQLREEALELRRAVGTPMLRIMLSATMGGAGLDDPDDFEDMDDLDVFFR